MLRSFETLTGLKFFVLSAPDSKHLEQVLRDMYVLHSDLIPPPPPPPPPQVLRDIYVLYSDFVLKNPFYENDSVLKCEVFDLKLREIADDYNRR